MGSSKDFLQFKHVINAKTWIRGKVTFLKHNMQEETEMPEQ